MGARVRLRKVEPEELLSEQEVVEEETKKLFSALHGASETYRAWFVVWARLAGVRKVVSPKTELVIAETPLGRGLVWRWWGSERGVVLFEPNIQEGTVELAERVTFFRGEACSRIKLVLDSMPVDAPSF